jgi:sugar lactone lactonase YvrE
MYMVGLINDRVNQYSLSTAFDLSTASYDSVNFSVASQDGSPLSIIFNNDGTKMYMVGVSTDTIYQYSLSTAFDLSTASYDSVSFSVASENTTPTDITFNNDGTKLFMVGRGTSSTIYQYSLSTAYDISTTSYDSISFSVNSQDTTAYGLGFNNNGTKMYMVGQVGNKIYQYSTGSTTTTNTLDLSTGSVFEITPTSNIQVGLSNPAASGTVSQATLLLDGAVNGYDLSGAAYDSVSFSVTSQETVPRDVAFKDDGTKMFLIGQTGDDVNEYALSTAWDISTASYTTVFSVSSQTPTPRSIQFNADGTAFFICGSQNNQAYQYTLSTAWDISTASYASDLLYLSNITNTVSGVFLSSDGTKLYANSYDNDAVYQYTLSPAYDLSTGSYDSVSFDYSSQTQYSEGITFKPDGTKMYLSDSAFRIIYEYSLSTAWDLSTASYTGNNFSVASEDLFPYGITFKPDGTKMYMVGNYTDSIYQYTTGSAYTVTYDSAIQFGGGTAPDSPLANETDVLAFSTRDGGTSYQAMQAIDGAK